MYCMIRADIVSDNIGIGQYSRLQYRYRIGSEKVESGHHSQKVLNPVETGR